MKTGILHNNAYCHINILLCIYAFAKANTHEHTTRICLRVVKERVNHVPRKAIVEERKTHYHKVFTNRCALHFREKAYIIKWSDNSGILAYLQITEIL